MQIVIDIDDKIYKEILYGKDGWWSNYVHNLIRTGIPIPKGHGRLIDADEIQCERSNFDTYPDYSRAFDEIYFAPTIIPADKEAENADSN